MCKWVFVHPIRMTSLCKGVTLNAKPLLDLLLQHTSCELSSPHFGASSKTHSFTDTISQTTLYRFLYCYYTGYNPGPRSWCPTGLRHQARPLFVIYISPRMFHWQKWDIVVLLSSWDTTSTLFAAALLLFLPSRGDYKKGIDEQQQPIFKQHSTCSRFWHSKLCTLNL